MARKRFITSDISIDEKVAAVAEENATAALMWPWFNTALDDWGRMGANPMEVKFYEYSHWITGKHNVFRKIKGCEYCNGYPPEVQGEFKKFIREAGWG